jgi:hypothetical protein
MEVTVIVNGVDCTGDELAWTPEDMDKLSQIFKDAAAYMRSDSHVHLNCEDDRVLGHAFCFIGIEQRGGGEPYLAEYMPPGSLDIKKLIRERNRRMDGPRRRKAR